MVTVYDLSQKPIIQPGADLYTRDPSTQEAETGGLGVKGQLGL